MPPTVFASDPAPQQLTAPCRKYSGRLRHPIEQRLYRRLFPAFRRIVVRPHLHFSRVRLQFCFALLVTALTPAIAVAAPNQASAAARRVADQGQTTVLSGRVVDARTGAALEQVLAVIDPTGAQ